MEEIKLINLITRHLSGEATQKEEEQLQRWLAQNDTNKKIFAEYLDLWKRDLPYNPNFDLAKGLQRLNSKIEHHEEQSVKTRTSFSWRKIAASLTLLLAACFGVYFLGKYSESNSHSTSFITCETSPSEQTTLTLSDGSIIQLNAKSVLRYPKEFSGFKREIYLSGEAFFEVAKDSLRPFIIHTEDITTQVLGTSFNIKSNDNLITVSVATGKVKVSHKQETYLLLRQEKITYSALTKKITRASADLGAELAWKNGTILFDDIQLVEAVKKLEHVYGIEVSFESKNLEKCLITGKYTNLSLEKILKAISLSTSSEYRMIGKKVMLLGKGCE